MVEASVESVTHTARVVENRVTIVTLSGPLFPSGSDEFSPLGERWLLALSDRLVDQPRNRVAIVGHTDSEGKPESNLALSQRRAQMVARYLIRQGVPAEQVQVEGRGQSEPIASNETPSGRALNRRVDFYIMPQG
jgi:OmpA-OmpF porin, OOP family